MATRDTKRTRGRRTTNDGMKRSSGGNRDNGGLNPTTRKPRRKAPVKQARRRLGKVRTQRGY